MPASTETDLIELVTREDLETLLPACGCGHRHPQFITPGCHPDAQMRVAYNSGVLAVFCSRCAAPLFAVKIAGRRSPN